MATDSAGQRAVAEAMKDGGNLQDLKSEFAKFKAARRAFEADWFLNSAFFVGEQWLYWNHGKLDRPRLSKWRETVVDNRILPITTARAAKKVKSRPSFAATPFTGSEDDLDAARVTEKVVDYDWVYLGLGQKLYQATLFAEIMCAGLWKIYWDSTAGESQEVLVDSNGQPAILNGRIVKASDIGDEGIPAGLSLKTIALGDVCVDLLSPFHFFPDPLATNMGEVSKAYEEKIRSPDYVKQRFGVELEADVEAPLGPVESRLFGSLMPATGSGYKGIRVYEFWAKPCPSYPKGKRVVWAQDQILAEEDEPFDPMPYVMFSGIKVPNRFWPTSITTQLRGPQVALNKVESQIQENANRLGNPSILTSRQANVFYGGVPGERIEYDSTVSDAVPQFLTPPEVPQYVREQIQRLTESMTEISGLHEVSNATVPTGVTAASAINLLQEADDTRIGPEIQDMEFSLAEAGTKIARLRAKYNTDERLMRIAGEDENWDIFAFRGVMMGNEPTVEVQAGSAMPRSKAAQQAAILEVLQTMFQYGLVPDQRDLRKVFKDYEAGALDNLFAGLSVTEQQIQRENREMGQGTAVQINAFDADQEHIDGHEEFQRSARYKQLPPNDMELVEMHVSAHRERLVQQTNMQVEAQAQAQAASMGAEHANELSSQSHQAALDVAKQHAAPAPPPGRSNG